MLKLICFDLDDTLWDFESALQRAEDALHLWLDDQYPPFARKHSADDLRALRGKLLSERADLRHDIGRVRLLAMQLAAERSGYDSNSARGLAEAAFKKFMYHRNQVELFADVVPVLERLRTRYRVCSITNGNADLQAIGITHLFHHSLAAEHVGAAKPAPDIFIQACRQAGVTTAEAVHIGDDAENDILAARAAGMKTIWINRRAEPWRHDQPADAEIRDLSELEARLHGL